MTVTSPAQAFIDTSRYYLSSEYLPKIRRAVNRLSEEDLWWRPNPASNSVGNLLLHLSGNIRQWVIHGIGGMEDVRERSREFTATGKGRESVLDRETLLGLVQATLAEVDGVLAGLDPERLLEERTIQGLDVTVLQALYHAVEHFSTHTGQILYIAKLRSGADLGFYEVEDGIATRSW